jgi:hypothetical protein
MSQINEETIEPVNTEIIQSSSNVRSIEETVNQAERYVMAMNRIRGLAVKATNVMDWSDQGGKPYLEKSGCDKIASTFGVNLDSPEILKEMITDDKGEYADFTVSGGGRWNNIETSEIGTCSSRDDFFGHKGGGLKPLSEVDLSDVRKKAFTNWANRIIKKLLGLSFTWEEISLLSDGKITKETVKKVEFGAGTRGGNTDSPESKKKRDEIRKMLLDLNSNDEAAAKKMLEETTSFQGTNGPVKGKNNVAYLTEKQLPIVHGQLKKKIDDFNKQLDKEAAMEGAPTGA